MPAFVYDLNFISPYVIAYQSSATVAVPDHI